MISSSQYPTAQTIGKLLARSPAVSGSYIALRLIVRFALPSYLGPHPSLSLVHGDSAPGARRTPHAWVTPVYSLSMHYQYAILRWIVLFIYIPTRISSSRAIHIVVFAVAAICHASQQRISVIGRNSYAFYTPLFRVTYISLSIIGYTCLAGEGRVYSASGYMLFISY